MSLIVTTSHSVLKIDLSAGEYRTLHRGRGLYYGLAANGSIVAVGARNRTVSSELPLADESGEILFFDDKFSLDLTVRPFNFPLRDIHELCWADNLLWVSCSYDNMIAIWDGSVWERWFPLGPSNSEPLDRNHFNSFLVEDDSIWLVAHNNGPSEMFRFDRGSRTLTEKVSLGIQSHNLWREQNALYTCSSGEGAIVSTDGFRLKTGGFPRGVAFSDDFRCVGISELAERSSRDFTTGRIAVYDRSWRHVFDVELHNQGLVLDMHFMNVGP